MLILKYINIRTLFKVYIMKNKIILFLFLLIYSLAVTQNVNITWQQCLGTDEDDSPYGIAYTPNGILLGIGIVVDNDSISNYHGSADAWLVELDTLGNIIWENCFGGSGGESFRKIIPLPDSEYYLLGGTNSTDGDAQSNIHNSYDIWVVKIDSAKHIIWERCLGSYVHDSPTDIVATDDGGVIVLGGITSSGGDISEYFGGTDAWLCRLDKDGNILWEKTYGGPNDERFMKILPTSHNTYVLIGGFYISEGLIDCQKDDSPIEKDVWLMEIDLLGNVIWQNCSGGSYYDDGIDVIEDDDGYVFTAYTNSNDGDVSGLHGNPGSIHEDIWIVKVDYNGNIEWQNCLGGSDTEFPGSIYKDSIGKGYMFFGLTNSNDGDVSGNHDTYGFTFDIWVAKLDSVGQIEWQQCIGSSNREIFSLHAVTKKDDYTYALNVQSLQQGGDVECHISKPIGYDAWVIQLKDCNHYAPHQPHQPTGTDTLCVNTDSITTYTTLQATNAWYYQWQLQPEEAGTITGDSLTAIVNWNPNYEGPALLKVRSSNDCGESNWSDSLVIQAYTCLGTDDNDIENSLRVYPNPATNTLIIEKQNHNKPYNIEIYNSTGTKVFTTNTATKITSIDVSEWISGVYVVKVASGSSCVSKKVVVR